MKPKLRQYLVGIVLGLGAFGPGARADNLRAGLLAPQKIGIIMMHGKDGSPRGAIAALVRHLQQENYQVLAPEMPWSRQRIYDATYDGAMAEIDRDFDQLRRRGAAVLVVAGHSLGANAAIGYAARRAAVAGLIALAPGHNPSSPLFLKTSRPGLDLAQKLIAAGKADIVARFPDTNSGERLTVPATPTVYLSWFSPKGPADPRQNIRAINPPRPIFIAAGTRDPNLELATKLADDAPSHPLNRFVHCDAAHLEVPTAAAGALDEWLDALRAPPAR